MGDRRLKPPSVAAGMRNHIIWHLPKHSAEASSQQPNLCSHNNLWLPAISQHPRCCCWRADGIVGNVVRSAAAASPPPRVWGHTPHSSHIAQSVHTRSEGKTFTVSLEYICFLRRFLLEKVLLTVTSKEHHISSKLLLCPKSDLLGEWGLSWLKAISLVGTCHKPQDATQTYALSL